MGGQGWQSLQYATSNPLHICQGTQLAAASMHPSVPSAARATQPTLPGPQFRKGVAAGERASTYVVPFVTTEISCPVALDGCTPDCATCQPKCSQLGPLPGRYMLQV